ncbi:MAG: hypothetical protein ACREC4_00340 [Methylocella sp.]
MPLNNFSVGRDCTIDVFDPQSGGVIALAIVTSFDAKQDQTRLKSKGLDGLLRHGVEPDGWSGKITLERRGQQVDALFQILENAYYLGQNVQAQTITQTIQENDGSITQWRYSGVALSYDDAGMWSNGKFISQTIGWFATKRDQVL